MQRLLLAFIFLFLVTLTKANDEMNVQALGGGAKKFFMDMTKKAMGVPSFKPENLAAQAFFREILDKYTKLDEKVKQDMMQHVPKVTKILNAAAKKFNIEPMQAFNVLSTFFTNFKDGAQANMLQSGLKGLSKMIKSN